MAFEIAKAGWVQRLSSILKRWKKTWLVLYQDGSVKYFESPDSHVAEEAARMPGECRSVKAGLQVTAEPPSGFGRTCLFAVEFSKSTWTFCSEGPDDMKAWLLALEQARVLQSASPPPYSTVHTHHPYSTQIHYGTHPPPYVVQGPAGQTIVYAQDPYYHHNRYDGTDVAVGMVGGLALGSLMWGPLLWW